MIVSSFEQAPKEQRDAVNEARALFDYRARHMERDEIGRQGAQFARERLAQLFPYARS